MQLISLKQLQDSRRIVDSEEPLAKEVLPDYHNAVGLYEFTAVPGLVMVVLKNGKYTTCAPWNYGFVHQMNYTQALDDLYAVIEEFATNSFAGARMWELGDDWRSYCDPAFLDLVDRCNAKRRLHD